MKIITNEDLLEREYITNDFYNKITTHKQQQQQQLQQLQQQQEMQPFHVVLNTKLHMNYRFYTLIGADTDVERLVTNAFFNSGSRNLEATDNFARIIVNEDVEMRFRINVIPYITGIKTTHHSEVKRTHTRRLPKHVPNSDQGWEILDDAEFMKQSFGLNANQGAVPHVKNQVHANMLHVPKTMEFRRKPFKKYVDPVLPTLEEIREQSAPHSFTQASKQKTTKEIEQEQDEHTYSSNIKSIVEVAPFARWGDPPLPTDATDTTQLPEELIPELVTQAISNIDFIKVLKGDSAFIASTITSSVLAIGTSLHTVCTTETTTTSKILNSVAIVSSLTTFCLALHKLFEKNCIPNCLPRLYPQLPSLAHTILSSDTKANSMSWIYPAISALISIIIGALTTFNICDIKSVIEKGRLLTTTKTVSTTANDIAKFVLEDVAGLDVTGDQKAFDELHQWAKRTSELSVMPVVNFIQNPELNFEIHNAVNTTLPIITNKYKSKDLSHAARSAYQLILNNISQLQLKIEAMKIITDACKRVETIGIMFGGKKGLGKSRLCTYIAEYIGNIMGFPKTIYNLNKSKDTGFYGPYGGAAFAEIQEFMALKENDPNLSQINQIISGDHFNLEAAHLGGKQQPFLGRVVFLTANGLCPDFLRVLEKGAAEATWDRILRFEVIDEKVQGRTGLNLHRKPDFSHLSFNFVTNTDETNGANLKKKPVTINEVLGIILYQTALREYQFLNSFPTELEVSAETQKRKEFLKGIIDRNNTSNSGQDFNILRIEGPQFVGKTRLADQVSMYIGGILPAWKIIKVQSIENGIISPKQPLTKGIYIIDDVIETNYSSYTKFLRWINAGHPDNLYIICTNHTYPQKWNRNLIFQKTTPYWEFDTKECSSGIARRLGLDGEIKCSDGSSVRASSRTTRVYVSKPGSISHQGKEITLLELKELVFNKFQEYLKCKEIVTVRHENYTDTFSDFDCVVKLDSYNHVSKAFSSLFTVTQARLGLIKGVSLTFKNHLIPEITRHFKSEEQLLPGIVNTKETLLQQAEALSVILNRAIPGISARFTIRDTGDDIILKDRTLYVGFNLTPDVLQIKHSATEQTITFTFGQETKEITYKVYALFLKNGVVPDILKDTPSEVISRLNMYVADNIKDSLFSYRTLLAEIEIAKQQFVEQNIFEFIKHRPVFSLIAGIIALTTTGALIALIAKMFKKEDKVTSNSAPDEEHFDPRVSIFAKRMKTAALKGEAEIKTLREEIAKSGVEREFNQWEHEWRSNSTTAINNYLLTAIEKSDSKKIIELFQLNPHATVEALIKHKSNMLTLKDERHQSTGPLEQLAERLRKSYVQIDSRIGMLYGLMIKGNLGVTVSHCVSEHTKTLTISSNGILYTAKVSKITRARDLMTFVIQDKTFPAAPDITSLFPTFAEMCELTSGWYIRPTTKPLIVNAPLEYIDRHGVALEDSNNPFFRVEGKSWKYRLTGIASCNNTFKSGDCGFPLIGTVNNKFYIIGIHNAYSLVASMGWFASISQEDISEITSNSASIVETRVAKTIKHPYLKENMVIDDALHELVMSEYEKSVYENVSPLHIHGYNKKLTFPSFPKHKKTYCDVAEKHLTCNTIGSALNANDVKDFSKLYPDSKGHYYPLFTQAVKYALSKSTEECFDKSIDSHVSSFLKTYYKRHYIQSKILKPHEIINGLNNLKPLDMTTSAGPKMKKFFGVNTKRPEGNEDILFINTSNTPKPWYVINTSSKPGGVLLSDFNHYMSMIKQGRPICVVVKDNAKVELLPKEKVEKGKVRLFNEMDLSINMVLKAYFGPCLDKIMEKHETTMFTIGMNPYKDATAHMLYFDNMDGEFINADFEALDKTVTAHLTKDFVDCFLPHVPQESRDALYKTLIYRLHSMNGNIYFTDNGNASGSFATTLLNCHVVAKTTLYTFCRKYQESFGKLPSYSDITDNIIIRGLGDDAIRKVKQIFNSPLTQQEFIDDALKYRLRQTPAKTDGEVSFCSREYIKHKNVYFPRLKKSSITSCLFWFKTQTPEHIFQNCFTALMEAGLWDEEFFNKVSDAVLELSKVFKFKLDIADYTLIQQCWVDYISGNVNTPVWGRSDPECILNNIDSNSKQTFLKMADMWLNEYVQKNKLEQPVYKYSAEGPDESLKWSCTVTLLDSDENLIVGKGDGGDKAEAKRNACDEVKSTMSGTTANVEIEWLCYQHLGKEYHVKKCEQQRRGDRSIFKSELAFLRYMKEQYPAINHLEKDARRSLMNTRCTTAIKTAIEGYVQAHMLPEMKKTLLEFSETLCDKDNASCDEATRLHKLVSDVEALHVKSNMGDTPIEPAVMNQAMNAQSAMALPSENNPQPTALAPAVTAPGDDIMSAIQIAQETTLNPMGAPNMLSVGAIGFDVKMLIYEQFLDCDTEFSTTESAPTGSIILQIPYAVLSQYTNYYIQQYALLHKRYTGSIKYRITAIGNQLLSGAVGVCWQDSRVNESTILISEAQKIAYEAKGVNNPFNEIHTLHDARQTLFYRNVADDLTDDLSDRPHLAIFVAMNVYNPYRDNTLVRFRIASRLANGREPNPFFFANPTRGLPSLSSRSTPTSVSPARPFNEVFTQTLNVPINIYTDGTLRNNTTYEDGVSYPPYSSKARNGAAFRTAFNGTFTRAGMTTSTGYLYNIETLQAKWPGIYNYYSSNGVNPLNTVVGIISQSTMDDDNFAILTGSAAYPGLGSYAEAIPDRTNWDFLKTRFGFRVSPPYSAFIPPNNIKILALLYNDAQITLGTFVGPHNRTYYYARFGQIKVVTNKGTAVYYLIATTTTTQPGLEDLRKNFGLLSQWQYAGTDAMASFKSLPDYPNLNIDTSLGWLDNFQALPLGYQALRLSDIPASALTIEDYPGPTATDESCLERWFYNRYKDLPTTTCAEMILVDDTSQRVVAIVRYFQEWRIFVINAETPNYRTLPINTSNLTIQSLVEIERTNAFPVTDTSLWFSRTSALAYQNRESLVPDVEFEEVKSNAALALGAGAISGIGQGLNQMADRKHQEKMQGNTFSHELTMQGNMFNQQSLMQGEQFGHEQRMALMNQDFQNMMQTSRFGQEKEMAVLNANEKRATDRMQSQNRMTERGLGTRTNFLNTSFSTSV